MIHGYVLIVAADGTANTVAEAIASLSPAHSRVLSVYTVVGRYDVIVHLEADDLEKFGDCLEQDIHPITDIKRITTCVVVRLG